MWSELVVVLRSPAVLVASLCSWGDGWSVSSERSRNCAGLPISKETDGHKKEPSCLMRDKLAHCIWRTRTECDCQARRDVMESGFAFPWLGSDLEAA